MALLEVVPGPVADVGTLAVRCSNPVLWTIQVKNGNLDALPNLNNTAVSVRVANADHNITTDDNGYFTLVFDSGENLNGMQVAITHALYLWKGNAGAAVQSEANHYQSNAPLIGVWRLRVRVYYLNSLGQQTAMSNAPVRVTLPASVINAATTAAGGAYANDATPCQKSCLISYGPQDAVSVVVKFANVPADVTTVAQWAQGDNAAVRRTAANAIEALVDKAGTTIVVELVVCWKLKVLVYDCGRPGANAVPVLRSLTPLNIQQGQALRDGPRTADDGSAFVDSAMAFATAYLVSIPKAVPDHKEDATVQVKINGSVLNLNAANAAVTRNGGTVTRSPANVISLTADVAVTEIEITFRLYFAWRLHVTVQDATEGAINTRISGAAVPLKQVPVTLQYAATTDLTPRTGDEGSAYIKSNLPLATLCTVSLSDTYGSVDTLNSAAVTVNGTAVDVATADAAVVRDNVTVTRTAANNITVSVADGVPEVAVTFKLQYPKIFIIGEGPNFPYALGLARRYAKGEAAADRVLAARADVTAPDTSLSDKRKWVIVSQFDVLGAPAGQVPRNFRIHRDPLNRDFSNVIGCFDVRKQPCWDNLANAFGSFDAIIFNNPHPGYGLHRCDVFGLRANNLGKPGKYISVHTLGYGSQLTTGEVAAFRADGNIVQNANGKWVTAGHPVRDMELAQNQRYFVRNSVGPLGYIGNGTDSTSDYADDGTEVAQPIAASFEAQAQPGVIFQDRVTHYRESIATTGLWASVLRCFRMNGNAALKAGGALYLHGSRNFGTNDLILGGGHLNGFANMGFWSGANANANIYYANYRTNFTNDRFHPSWFAEITFGPSEPGLANAQCYRRGKT